MRTLYRQTICIAILCACSLPAIANSTSFTPSDAIVGQLPDTSDYTWGIDIALQPGQVITEAKFTVYDIYDWRVEPDTLYIHLLDNPLSGVNTYPDNEGSGGDNFAGQGILVGTWSDPFGGDSTNFDLVFDLGALGLLDELNAYAATVPSAGYATFGFGIDPDCHYYMDNMGFDIKTSNTTTVPAPGALLLGAIGVFLTNLVQKQRRM